MAQQFQRISAVPTNIITGFLGAGKTSAILQLLKNKPSHERWAVLVNEFGEIGIDGKLLSGHNSEQQGVYVREVPGGCMCCSAGLPMQVALTQLLKQARPDRLLIEPTGLGHPEEVLHTLGAQHFQGILEIQKVLTLVDARRVSDSRYTEHEIFQQQIAIADVVVGNKQDLYDAGDTAVLESFIKKHTLNDVQLIFTEQGCVEPSLLNGLSALAHKEKSSVYLPSGESTHLESNSEIPECGFIKAVNQGEGFASIGWRFSEQYEFDHNKLFAFLSGVNAERLKAVFMTEGGGVGYNLSDGALTEMRLDYCDESRIEIIARQLDESWESQLFACVSHKSKQT